jgi:hypothetical protein
MAGLFGPQSSVTSSHIQSICDTLEIPHMETRWDYRMKRDDYSVNLYPHPHALGQVCQIPNIKVVDTSPLPNIFFSQLANRVYLITKGFPFYDVTLTYADSAHF